MAVWVSQAAADLVSKATAIILIITIFASLGFEHSVANMFVGKEGGREGGREGGGEGGIPEIFISLAMVQLMMPRLRRVSLRVLQTEQLLMESFICFVSVWPPKFISW